MKTIETLLSHYQRGLISKNELFFRLISILEGSENESLRIASIKGLCSIKPKNIFETLEKLLVSDENKEIRRISGVFIINHFIERGVSLLRWVIHHEKSGYCLTKFYKALIRRKTQHKQIKSLLREFERRFSRELEDLGVNRKESMMISLLECYESEQNPHSNQLRTKHIEDSRLKPMIICQDVCILLDSEGFIERLIIHPAGDVLKWIEREPWVFQCFSRLKSVMIPKYCNISADHLDLPAHINLSFPS